MAYLRLRRPEKKNALNPAMLDALLAWLPELAAQQCRALVICAEGDHFCAGADIEAMSPRPGGGLAVDECLHALAAAPFPIIAAMQGPAYGAGLELALFCDWRITIPTAKFSIPAARLGVVIDPSITARLTALGGLGMAQRLLLAAEVIDGDAALRAGLVHQLVEPDQLQATAEAMAGRFAKLAPISIAGMKAALGAVSAIAETSSTAAHLSDWVERAWTSADLQEGRRAFAERRTPRFEGR